jgi:predicted membrane-bound mannosyltransferase
MWGGSLGLLAYYWQEIRPTGMDLRAFLQTLETEPLNPNLINPVRVPMVIVAAIFVLLLYVLLKRLLSTQVALISVLLLTLSPFHIALSRVLHHDALTTTFMVLSLLVMIGYWFRGWAWYWLLFSAGFTGLACLSKPIGLFMIPFAVGLGILNLYIRWRNGQWGAWATVRRFFLEVMGWGVGVGLTMAALLPAAWVIPGEIIQVLFNVSVTYSQAGHIDGHFFLGQVLRDPGVFY